MRQDLSVAIRSLRKQPMFALLAVVTLAVGIGATTAMFSLVQGVLLAPPPYRDPARLVLVSPARIDGQPYDRGAAIGHWKAWRDARALESTAMYGWTFNFLVLDSGSQSVGGMVVTRDYFRVLGLSPVLGRTFAESEAGRPNVAPTAIILGHDLWQRQFGGDPHVLGKTVRLSRMPAPLPVVGVMPPGVRFLPDPGAAAEPNYDVNATVDFWLARTPDETQPEQGAGNLVARLREDATVEIAGRQLRTLAAGVARQHASLAGLTARVESLREHLNRDGRQLLVPLFAAVALLFVIACANVTGLLLARGLQRHQEYATRAALGATRARLLRQSLTETTLLAVVGVLVGTALALAAVAVLKAIGEGAVPRVDAVTVGWPVLAFAALATVIAAAIAGLLPALRASRPSHDVLHGARSSTRPVERRLLVGVATVQLVLTVSLLAGTALLVRTGRNLERVTPGYDVARVLAMTVTSVQPDQWKPFHLRALEEVKRVPGVAHAAFAWGLPLTGNMWPGEIVVGAQGTGTALTDRIRVPLRAITPEYFDALGMALVDGRRFETSDDDQAPPVAIVNRTFVRQYLNDGQAIGRRFQFAGRDAFVSIVGVIADTRTMQLDRPAEPEVYLPLWQSRAFSKHLVIRATGDPALLAPRVRAALRGIDPTAAVERITTMSEVWRASMAIEIFALRLLGGFAAVATLLACVGLYGVLSLSVNARTKEIAVRKAIGAQARQVLVLVLAEGARLVLVGIALGSLAALLLGRAVERLLFGVSASDPLSLAAAAGLLSAVALVACAIPAWRASRVELMDALRQD